MSRFGCHANLIASKVDTAARVAQNHPEREYADGSMALRSRFRPARDELDRDFGGNSIESDRLPSEAREVGRDAMGILVSH
jgi:hypothetical protein